MPKIYTYIRIHIHTRYNSPTLGLFVRSYVIFKDFCGVNEFVGNFQNLSFPGRKHADFFKGLCLAVGFRECIPSDAKPEFVGV